MMVGDMSVMARCMPIPSSRTVGATRSWADPTSMTIRRLSPPWDQETASNEEYEEYETGGEEEGGYEYASYHQGAEAGKEEGHTNSGVYATGTTLVEEDTPLLEGELRGVSGDGCGDGGYCGGRWVEKSGKGHYSGEHIGGDPWEPADFLCITIGWTNPVTGYACGAYGAARHVTTRK